MVCRKLWGLFTLPCLRGQLCSNQHCFFLVLCGGKLPSSRVRDGDDHDLPHLLL